MKNTSLKIGVIGTPGGKSSEALADAFAALTGRRLLVDIEQCVADCDGRTIHSGTIDLAACDALVIKKISSHYSAQVVDRLYLLSMLESRGIRIFSSPVRIAMAVNRLTCTTVLRNGNIPMPQTIVVENIDSGLEAVQSFGHVVMKPLYSTKARGMKMVPVDSSLRAELHTFQESGNPLLYLQRKVAIPGRDLGVVFLGGHYLASYARVAGSESWNTTIHAGGRYAKAEPDKAIIALADKAQKLFGLDFTCVDVVETSDGPLVFEVSAFGGFTGLGEACGMDAAQLYAQHVVEKLHHG